MYRMFAKFSARIGVSSYREYEEQHIKRAQELAKQKTELAVEGGKLSNQIEFEESVDWTSKIRSIESKLRKEEEDVQSLEAQEKKLTTTRNKVRKPSVALSSSKGSSHWYIPDRTYSLQGLIYTLVHLP